MNPVLAIGFLGSAALGLVLAAALMVGAFMADPTIIGPQDTQLQLQASTTKTASFNSAGVDLGSGFAPAGGGQPMQAIVNYSAGDFTTGDETYKFQLTESSDNVTFTACSALVAAPVTVAAPAGAITIGATVQKRYVRLEAVLAGTTPSITYLGWLQPKTIS